MPKQSDSLKPDTGDPPGPYILHLAVLHNTDELARFIRLQHSSTDKVLPHLIRHLSLLQEREDDGILQRWGNLVLLNVNLTPAWQVQEKIDRQIEN